MTYSLKFDLIKESKTLYLQYKLYFKTSSRLKVHIRAIYNRHIELSLRRKRGHSAIWVNVRSAMCITTQC
jgi:hypothetical protein